MSILPSVYAWLLLPPNADLKTIDDLALKGLFPKLQDLYPAIVFAILFSIARVILTPLVFKPLAIYARSVPPLTWRADSSIEDHMPKTKPKSRSKASLSADEVKTLASTSNQKVTVIEAYLKAKRVDGINRSKITKFVEAFWRCSYYTVFTIIAVYILFIPKPVSWLFNSRELYENWPFHGPIDGYVFYHNVQLGCYIHQLMWTEVSRADSMVDIIHHVTTIILIFLSHTQMILRTGTATMFLHDVSDIFLESAKCFNYAATSKGAAKWFRSASDILFAFFAISFFVFRLYWFPRLIVFGMLYRASEILGQYPGWAATCTLLCVLMVLHVYWGYLILKMAIAMFAVGSPDKDVRSDDEEEEDESATKDKKRK